MTPDFPLPTKTRRGKGPRTKRQLIARRARAVAQAELERERRR